MDVITNNNIKCSIVLAVLQDVMDPEIGLNVVDLGLIYRVDFEEENKNISVSMTLTTQFCPMGESIVDAVSRAIQQAFTDYRVQVHLVFDPQWTNEMISETGREFLNQ
jgi:metal-sulfur cluster biosynthetic enzyme